VIAASAAAWGHATFVDMRPDFTSHELRSATPWLTNLQLALWTSFHPNEAGQADYAAELAALTDGGLPGSGAGGGDGDGDGEG
jgi:hypothetical protein